MNKLALSTKMSSKNEIIMNLLNAGMKPKEVAKACNIHRTTVFRVKAKFRDTGTVKRKEGSGLTRKIRTPQLVNAVKSRISRNPVQLLRKMARNMKVSATTMRRVIKEDLGARSLARTCCSLLTVTY